MTSTDSVPQRKSTRNKASISSDDLTMESMKALMSEQKNEIINSFTSKIDNLNTTVTILISTINKLEDKVKTLEEVQKQQKVEIENIKEHLEAFSPPDFDPEDLIYETQQRINRADNLVLFGVPEKPDGSIIEKREHDNEVFKKVMTTLDISDAHLLACNRIGKPKRDGHRILKVKFANHQERSLCLRKSKLLKNTEFRNVFIKPDLTPYQQAMEWELRNELKARRANNEDVVLLHGRIQRKPQNFPQ